MSKPDWNETIAEQASEIKRLIAEIKRLMDLQGEPIGYISPKSLEALTPSGMVYVTGFNLGHSLPIYLSPPAPVSADIESAAQKLASCMDYPWEYMPEQGRNSMREHAKAIISAAGINKVKELNQ